MKCKYKKFLKAAYINYEEDYCGHRSGAFTKPTVTTPIIVITGATAIIACAISGATIYYTLDGSTPTSSSTLYTGAITLILSCTIKAIAVKPGMSDSAVASESYVHYLTQWKIVGNSEVHTLPYPDGVVLPTGYKRCEYLQSDGTVYIELPYGFEVTDDIYIKCAMSELVDWGGVIAAKTWDTSANKRFTFGGAILKNSVRIFSSSFGLIGPASGELSPQVIADTNVHEWTYANYKITIDNSASKTYSNFGTGGSTDNLRIFYGYDRPRKYKIYDYRHTKGNTEYHLIPCLDSNDTPCMYDVINNQAYYNSAGSGSFTYKLYPQPTEIWSCGEYNPIDSKYHILVQPLGGSIADIALTEPLRKVNDVADTIEFPVALEAFCNTDGSQIQTTLPDDTILHIKQLVKNGDFSDGSTEWHNFTSLTSCDYSQNKAVLSNIEVGHGYKFAVIQDIRSNIVIGNSYYFKYNAIPCKDIVLGADFSNRSNTRVSCVGNTDNIVSNVAIPASLNQFYLGYSATTDYEVGDTTEVDNVVSFELDVMFADCPSLKPTTASDFEVLFTNIKYIAYSDTAIDVIVKDGKLYKYVDTEGKALLTIRIEESGGELSPLDTPTTELVDAPQIAEAESYTCVITPGGKAVSWSSFETE